ncbi:MAG: surface lipoprotein assembly modifier [Gammaproteobacteria bacterium]|nr:surface lipoprotein assembly modifier [Gammaproteobacteria bacterium]
MTTIKKYLILFVALFFITPLHATEAAYDLEQLQSLFKAYKRQQAYDYAKQHLQAMEGEPYFDYIYGVSAIDTGHASQGVFALERVLLTFPNDHVARLELARGYFILEEYARSRVEFESVMAIEPPRAVQETALRYLDMIRLREARYRTTSNGYVEIAIGNDTNVNSGSEPDPQADIQLIDTSTAQEDTYTGVVASWQITHPFAPGWLFNTAITGSAQINKEFKEFNTLTATLQTGVRRIYKESKYSAELVLQQFNLDSEKYRTLTGINLDWDFSISQKARLSTGLQYSVLDYPDPENEVRNADSTNLSLGYTYTFATQMMPMLLLNLNYGQDKAEFADDPLLSDGALGNTERDFKGAQIGLLMNLSQKLALQTTASIQNSQYGGVVNDDQSGFTSSIRDEDLISASFNLLWLINRTWRMDLKTSYLENRSNIDLYNYNRTQISANFQYAF